ncbi:PIN domain-containing protein [Thalassospira sp.]|uniref:PIN domain-containing protein n=1 Tax=Thalassospira sp. TaxID=1912094 RepID=UPI0027324576|nr:PIN domain-containing protein [Thalassospira sp.]MDP2697469.1 PIN domain-containing protein [Thalassospira sp.]
MQDNFFDTNILLYLASNDHIKAQKAEILLASGGVISVQVLNEITSIARRKMNLSWDDTRSFLALISGLLQIEPLTRETHQTGLDLAEKYRLSVYDAMIVAAALLARCNVLWSEDMQDGLVVNGTLRILNPFSTSP